MMRLQEKGNRFVVVDKETDQIKAQQQIAKSSFQELYCDTKKEHKKSCTMEWQHMASEKINFERIEGVYC